jgi:hypothetical protein
MSAAGAGGAAGSGPVNAMDGGVDVDAGAGADAGPDDEDAGATH